MNFGYFIFHIYLFHGGLRLFFFWFFKSRLFHLRVFPTLKVFNFPAHLGIIPDPREWLNYFNILSRKFWRWLKLKVLNIFFNSLQSWFSTIHEKAFVLHCKQQYNMVNLQGSSGKFLLEDIVSQRKSTTWTSKVRSPSSCVLTFLYHY